MVSPITHGWTTVEPDDPAKDVSQRNLNDHAVDYAEAGDISTQAFADAAAAGTSDELPRADHKHAMPANPVTAHEVDTTSVHGITDTTALVTNPLGADLEAGGFLIKGAAAGGGTGGVLYTAAAAGTGEGGSVDIYAGDGPAGQDGGLLRVRAGIGNGNGFAGGTFEIRGNSSLGDGGASTFAGGKGEYGRTGGDLDLSSGTGNDGGTQGASLMLWGGGASTSSGYIRETVDAISYDHRAGTASPTAGAGVAANIGSQYVRDNAGVGELWFKTGAADTAWTQIV